MAATDDGRSIGSRGDLTTASQPTREAGPGRHFDDWPTAAPTHLSPEERAAATALGFLTALYGDAPTGHLVLWTSRAKHAVWPDTLAAAATQAVRLARRDEVFFGVGPRRRVLASGRGTARDVLWLPALWADLDVKAPARKAHQLPPDKAAAMAILADFPLPASALVDDGYGYHAYWFLDEPYLHTNVGLTRDLLRTLGQALVVIAERHGWRIATSGYEPARVVRMPGTFNRKERRPQPVRVERLDASMRYSANHLLETAVKVIVATRAGRAAPSASEPTAS